jgi:hypothetical protein
VHACVSVRVNACMHIKKETNNRSHSYLPVAHVATDGVHSGRGAVALQTTQTTRDGDALETRSGYIKENRVSERCPGTA